MFNLVGFTRARDKGIVREEYLTEIASKEILLPINKEHKVYSYLNEAQCISSITLALFDKEKYIGPYRLLSDGKWIWPSHYVYSVMKTNKIDEHFLKDIKQNEYKAPKLSFAQLKEITTFVELKLMRFG